MRLFTDEPIRFFSSLNVAVYNTPLIMQVKGQISINCLRMALNQVVIKQTVLRTSLIQDMSTGELRQHILKFDKNSYAFEETNVETEACLAALIDNEKDNIKSFRLVTRACFSMSCYSSP